MLVVKGAPDIDGKYDIELKKCRCRSNINVYAGLTGPFYWTPESMKIFRFNIATWVHFRLVQYIFRICQPIFSWSPHTLKALTAILAPLIILPNFTHKSNFNIAVSLS